ncbi:MAG: double-strand break repair helicase AddA [Alphaproteobacteria bacterium]|nr:double-strand break repair helicase AddA [Alphaproteobacteria bacterium]
MNGAEDPQRLASDPAASVWVAANAGAGKTHVLVNRVLRLLLAGSPVQRILCLTFTKAAAAEMANRLHRELGRWANLDDTALTDEIFRLGVAAVRPEELQRARRLFATTLEAPGGLKIQTIHAFCQSLLSRFPLEAGLAPHFQVLDERSRADLLGEARAGVLADAGEDGNAELAAALSELVVTLDEESFATMMEALAGARGRMRRALDHCGGDLERLLAETASRLRIDPTASRESLLADAIRALPMADLRRAAAALARSASVEDQKRAARLGVWLGAAEPDAADFPHYAAAFLRQDGAPLARLATKAALADDGAIAGILAAEQTRILDLTERLGAVETFRRTASLWRLARAVLDRLEEMKRAAAAVDYDDLILTTRALLQSAGAAWVLYKLDGGIDHVLVDEAQDTSPDQWAVVAALAEEFFAGEGARERGRTLFAVGDEKQSIYSFQGAEPAMFGRMRDHFETAARDADLPWRAVGLDRSFRSSPAVLAAVDRVFADPAAAAGVVFDDRPVRHEANRAGDAGRVEVWPLVEPAEEAEPEPWDAPLDQLTQATPMARLAQKIARRVRGWIGREILESRGRTVRAGDIMILVRRRNRFFEEMIRALKAHGVPVAGADRMLLGEQLAVLDLVALGHFLLLPEDDLTCASVLKGPLFGLSDEALTRLAAGREGSLWRALRRDGAHAGLVAELEGLRARADLLSPFDLYADLLGRGGGRLRIVARLGPEANDPIDEFLNLALEHERAHAPSLEGFLHWLARAETEIKRDLEVRADAVRVMTVHGAKGLEANIVILPDTTSLPDGRQEPQILWHAEPEPALPLWSPSRRHDDPAAARLRAAAAEARLEEYRRLLYVAMTRARDRLYVCGWKGERQVPSGCWYHLIERTLLPGAAQVMLEDGEEVWRHASVQAAPVVPAGREAAAPSSVPLPDWWHRPPPAEPVPSRPLMPSRPEDDEPAAQSPLGPDQGWRFRRGRILHRLLQSLPDLPEVEREAAAGAYLSEPRHGLDAPERETLLAEVMAVLRHPDLEGLFGAGSAAEVPLAGLVNGRAIAGQVDRLLVTDRKVLVADFKSNRPPPLQPANVARAYLQQMAQYLALLRRIYPDREVTAVLVWTDGPRVMPLPEDLLQPWMP